MWANENFKGALCRIFSLEKPIAAHILRARNFAGGHVVEFDTDWRTLGKHRVMLRSMKGFPTEVMRQLAEVARLAADNNMSARARIVEIVFREEKVYDITIGTTMSEDAFVHRSWRAQLGR